MGLFRIKKMSLQVGSSTVVALNSGRCGYRKDVTIIHIDGKPFTYCIMCLVDVFAKNKPYELYMVSLKKCLLYF